MAHIAILFITMFYCQFCHHSNVYGFRYALEWLHSMYCIVRVAKQTFVEELSIGWIVELNAAKRNVLHPFRTHLAWFHLNYLKLALNSKLYNVFQTTTTTKQTILEYLQTPIKTHVIEALQEIISYTCAYEFVFVC